MIFIYECWGFRFADMLWRMRRGRNQGRLWLVRLTVGHRGGEEESPEVSPCSVTIEQLCVSETGVNKGMRSHKAALIKGDSFAVTVSNVLSIAPLPVLPAWLTDRQSCWTNVNSGQPENEWGGDQTHKHSSPGTGWNTQTLLPRVTSEIHVCLLRSEKSGKGKSWFTRGAPPLLFF